MSAPRRRPGTLVEDVPGTGESVLLHPETGRVLALNAAGAAVWELLDGRRTIADLAATLAAAAEVAPEVALRDVRALLDQLAADGFLAGEPPPGGGATS